jgi:hypothetical protein
VSIFLHHFLIVLCFVVAIVVILFPLGYALSRLSVTLFFRLQQYKVVEMKLLAQQRELQVLLFGLKLFRDANPKYDHIHDLSTYCLLALTLGIGSAMVLYLRIFSST